MLFLMERNVSVADHVDGSAFLNQYPKITLWKYGLAYYLKAAVCQI